MENKGWALTLDSDPVTNFFTNINKNKSSSSVAGGGSFSSVRMFQLGGRAPPSPQSDNDNRVAIDEVDFFNENKNLVVEDDRDDNDKDNKQVVCVGVKKEKSNEDVDRFRTGFDVNVRKEFVFPLIIFLFGIRPFYFDTFDRKW